MIHATDTANEIRAAALAQLMQDRRMIAKGGKKLAAAQKNISDAQELLDQSADTLRRTHSVLPPEHIADSG
jgi:hypothetical protein